MYNPYGIGITLLMQYPTNIKFQMEFGKTINDIPYKNKTPDGVWKICKNISLQI